MRRLTKFQEIKKNEKIFNTSTDIFYYYNLILQDRSGNEKYI